MLRVAVLASGSGSNLQSLLDKSRAGLVDAKVELVISDKPGAYCLERAAAAGVPVTVALPKQDGQTRQEYDEQLAGLLAAAEPDLIVLAGFMRILSPGFCKQFAGRILNIHPALLPKHKGAHGIRDTLAAGDDVAGCTTHLVTAELDGGPILLQAQLDVADDDDKKSLAARVLELEHWLLPRSVELFAQGRVSPDGAVQAGDSWLEHVAGLQATWSQGF